MQDAAGLLEQRGLRCVELEEIEFHADTLDVSAAAQAYETHGALVVRGLMSAHVAAVTRDIEAKVQESLGLLDQAQLVAEGWRTPNGTLFIPAPDGFSRDKQVMVVALRYQESAALLQSALHSRTLDLAEAILGPNVELFGGGQVLYKEPVGGHAKHLHQDSAYFEHRYQGPLALLAYCVDTNLDNGALYVIPGSHTLGHLEHVDTTSHLGLTQEEWPWAAGVAVTGSAGDVVLFNVRTIHGSQSNFSKAPRPVFIHRYRRADDYVVVRGTTAANRTEAQAGAATARKEGQEGLLVRGYREWHPPDSDVT